MMYCFKSLSKTSLTYGDVPIVGKRLQNFDLCTAVLVFVQGGLLTCHTCCVTGPRFLWWHYNQCSVLLRGWSSSRSLVIWLCLASKQTGLCSLSAIILQLLSSFFTHYLSICRFQWLNMCSTCTQCQVTFISYNLAIYQKLLILSI